MGFGVDMAKAREIHKTNIRAARAEKFKELDIEFQRAIETDEIYIMLAPIINGLRQFAEQSNKNVPIVNQIFKAPTI